MTAYFDILGLPLRVTADHPDFLDLLNEDLRVFRARKPRRRAGEIRLSLQALPPLSGDVPYPKSFLPYSEVARQDGPDGTIATRYARSEIIVLSHRKQRRIEVGVVPTAGLLPDPAWHYVFTQPVSPWLKERGLFFLHAGCVAEDSAGILLAGSPRSGKTTLTLAAVRGGLRFLGDEQPLLEERADGLRVHAFPRRIRLDRSGAGRFPELRPLLRSPVQRIAFHAETVWQGRAARSCRPAALLFPRFRKEGGLRLRRISPPQALARLLQDDHFIWYRDNAWNPLSENHLRLFRRLAEETPAYTLLYGDTDLKRVPILFRRILRGSG